MYFTQLLSAEDTSFPSDLSCQSLFSEDGESPEGLLFRTSGSFSDVSRPNKPFSSSQSPDKRLQTGPSPIDHCPGIHSQGSHSSPASLAGSLTDIPVVLVNGAPEPELQSPPEMHPTQTIQRSLSRPSSPHSESTCIIPLSIRHEIPPLKSSWSVQE